MKLTRQFLLQIGIGLASATLLSILVSSLAFWSFMRVLNTNQSIQEKLEIIDKINDIPEKLTEAQNYERGYVLTGEEQYLDLFTSTLFDLDYTYNVVQKLLANEPEQKQKIDDVHTLVNQRIVQFNAIIELRRNQGLNVAILSIKRLDKTMITDQIRQIINDIEAQEKALLFYQEQEKANSLQQSIIAFSSGLGVNLVIFGWVYRLIHSEIHKRMKAEEKIQQLNVSLEERILERTEQLEKTLLNLQQTQSQLVQQEKMSSLGILVAGIAHEINNPVNFIHGNLNHLDQYIADLLRLIKLYQHCYPDPKSEIEELADEIDLEFMETDLEKILASMNIGTDRIRKIVLSLRNFSRIDESEFKLVDIHEGIESTLLILQHRTKAQPERPGIEIIRNYTQLPQIQCYPGPLNQVFMNILVNAIDALEETNMNRNVTEIKNHPSQILIQTSKINSQWIKIAIGDNGIGIPESIKARIFEPFFTTKPVGKGTGMGMSISYEIIVKKHQGKLTCLSTPGQGTEFIMELPIEQVFAQSN